MRLSTITNVLAAAAFAVSLPAAAADNIAASSIELDTYDSFKKEYALGVRQHRLNAGQRVVGWQLSEHWYFGKNRGDDDGFGFIWQSSASTQVAFTNEGVVVRRRL